jgi:hypothetical protein
MIGFLSIGPLAIGPLVIGLVSTIGPMAIGLIFHFDEGSGRVGRRYSHCRLIGPLSIGPLAIGPLSIGPLTTPDDSLTTPDDWTFGDP